MNDFSRVVLYQAYHEIIAEEKKEEETIADVVGPVCESGDFFAKDRKLPRFKEGDYLIIMGTGAYGFSMASNYNSRPRASEVLVDQNRCYLIRRGESYLDLIQGESIPPRLLF
ncbi:MAG TPA: diaminopimelate decarboxylase, partial [Candidatus Omnitrophica bacterium]|nr:diaminopimelate decarboxylase [Candidatus Omnitrophota bacterium]